jgi:hypothetical protein
MTFAEIVALVTDQLNQTSVDAQMRVGRKVNDRYRRVTSTIGVVAPRRTSVSATAVVGEQTLTFEGVEKIYNVQDRSDSACYRLLEEVSVDEILEQSSVSDSTCSRFAIYNTTSTTVTILMDCVPSTTFDLYAEGLASPTIMSGTNEPAFAASFHDILYYGALADEYRKLMRKDLADDAERMYEKRLSELRMSIAASAYMDLYQGKRGGPRPRFRNR